MTSEWRYALASVAGTSHLQYGAACQDFSACRVQLTASDGPVLVAVASDGAGSACRGSTGATLACSLLLDATQALFEGGGQIHDFTRPFVAQWLTRLHAEISLRADAEDLTPRDFACTLLVALIGVDDAAFAQIGDGAIVVSSTEEPDDYSWEFWPQKSEYVNTTFFATDPLASEHLLHDIQPQRVTELALLTDGLERLALHFQSQTVHGPFFRPIFSRLRLEPQGHSTDLSTALATFLSSPAVCERTDDDKTLLIATRR